LLICKILTWNLSCAIANVMVKARLRMQTGRLLHARAVALLFTDRTIHHNLTADYHCWLSGSLPRTLLTLYSFGYFAGLLRAGL